MWYSKSRARIVCIDEMHKFIITLDWLFATTTLHGWSAAACWLDWRHWLTFQFALRNSPPKTNTPNSGLATELKSAVVTWHNSNHKSHSLDTFKLRNPYSDKDAQVYKRSICSKRESPSKPKEVILFISFNGVRVVRAPTLPPHLGQTIDQTVDLSLTSQQFKVL